VWVNAGIGYTTQLNGNMADDKLLYELTGMYRDYVSANYFSFGVFLNKNWGMQFQTDKMIAQNSPRNEAMQALNARYQDQYYIKTDGLFPDGYHSEDILTKTLFGITHRTITGKWEFRQHVSLGFTTSYGSKLSAYLKEQNTNTIWRYSLRCQQNFDNKFTAAIGAMIQYRLAKRWLIYGAVNLSYFRLAGKMLENATNLHSSQQMANLPPTRDYARNILAANIMAGITFEMQHEPFGHLKLKTIPQED
jgi:hypothetical protein